MLRRETPRTATKPGVGLADGRRTGYLAVAADVEEDPRGIGATVVVTTVHHDGALARGQPVATRRADDALGGDRERLLQVVGRLLAALFHGSASDPALGINSPRFVELLYA
jgi:hypothetical protein